MARAWPGVGVLVACVRLILRSYSAFIPLTLVDSRPCPTGRFGSLKGEVSPAVALATLDIAFLSDDLTKMPEIIALSRRTLSVIRRNIAFSVVLNVVSVLAAGLGWISPIGGAVLQGSGASAVILNAVRLLRR